MIYRILQTLLVGMGLVLCQAVHSLANPAGDRLTGKPSFSFLENKGQITDQYGQSRPDIDFKVSAGGVNVFIGDGAIHYQWARPADTAMFQKRLASASRSEAVPDHTPLMWDMYRMDVTLIGADKNAPLIKESKLDYYERYYLPQCGPQGATASSYEKLTYKNVYPNIDWVLYVQDGHMKYDFVVHPGGKVSDIRLQYGGATSLKPNAAGEVTAFTPFGSVTEKAPVSFQEDGKAIASRFVLVDNTLGFAVAQYEGALTIDPTLVWGTYYGDLAIYDISEAVAYDTFQGDHVYLSGMTMGTMNIATAGAYQVSLAGEGDAYLVKFNTDGVRQWGTYFGGTGTDGQAASIVCDTFGNIYMAAITHSPTNIATPGCFQDTLSGYAVSGGFGGDNFIAKFDYTGSRLWATYYGGDNFEMYPDLATDGLNIYMVSSTSSASGIATPGSHQPILASQNDAYLVKFDSAGNRLWATYYGGSSFDQGSSVTCDNQGFIYITGYANSVDGIATPASHQPIRAGSTANSDAFIAKFNPEGIRQWGTYYGGVEDEQGYSIIYDEAGYIYLAGTTESSSDIATPGTQQTSLSGGVDVFIAKFDHAGQRQWATYYGGPENDWFPSLTSGSGKLFLTAATFSLSGIATPGAYQTTNNATLPVWGTVFLGEFRPASGIRDWATYYGGDKAEVPGGIAYDEHGYVYVCGATGSASGIATPGSHKDTLLGPGFLGFLSKFCIAPNLLAYNLDIAGPDSLCSGEGAYFSIEAIEDVTAYIWTLPSGWSGDSDSSGIAIISGATGGLIGVQIVRCEDTSEIQTLEVPVFPPDPAVITIDGFVLGTVKTTYTSYQWLYNDTLIPGATGRTHNIMANGDYRVITTNSRGCVDTSAAYTVKNYTGISEKQIASRIKIFPNPVQAQVSIQSPVPVDVTLSSLEGRSLLHKENAQSIDIGDLAPGLYILRIHGRNGSFLKAEQLVKVAK